MPSKDYLMLRSAQRARLEARTARCSSSFGASINFLTASKARGQGILREAFRDGLVEHRYGSEAEEQYLDQGADPAL
jgi:hypothetical protein